MIPSSSLVPENDPTVLFTTAGMQQFKRYYLFPDEAPSARITTCQKCVRTGDIDEVGDETHLTFFEMLGNFSFGYEAVKSEKLKVKGENQPYFKKEAIEMAWEFLTKVLEIDKSRIYATYFKDDAKEIPEDTESSEILQKVEGLGDIRPQGFDDNFWSLGTEGSPGGPTVEFYVDDVEIWNLVFNEFVLKDDKYEPTELKGVDTGMGFERMAAVMQGVSDFYQTDLFAPIINEIERISGKKYEENKKEFRIIADHIKSAVFMINDGVEPSNKDRGYVLRRIMRRAYAIGHRLGLIDFSKIGEVNSSIPVRNDSFLAKLADLIIDTYRKGDYKLFGGTVGQIMEMEEGKFVKTYQSGMARIEEICRSQEGHFKLRGAGLFDLYQTYGFPLELSLEEAARRNILVANDAVKTYREKLTEHQEKSRTASAGMFKGGLADNKVETTRLHTAAHLLLAALREVLGEQVEQKGSNITEERLRFDLNNPEKLTPEQIEKVESIVNEKITEALPVEMQEMSLNEAKKSGATGSFSDRYGEVVKIYTIGAQEEPFSREICGGPHVTNTSELGHFKITKEESSSSGIRRIKAILE